MVLDDLAETHQVGVTKRLHLNLRLGGPVATQRHERAVPDNGAENPELEWRKVRLDDDARPFDVRLRPREVRRLEVHVVNTFGAIRK